MGVDAAGVELGALAPDLLNHLAARHHPSRTGRQQREQVELGRGERHRLAVAQHLVPAEVDDHAGELQPAWTHLGGAAPLPSQLGTDAGGELTKLEGLGDEVVGADLQADDDIDDVAVAGDHDDGHLDPCGAQPAADVEPCEAREVEVEEDEVGVGLFGHAQAFDAVGGHLHLKAVLATEQGDHAAHRRVVVDDQDGRLRGLPGLGELVDSGIGQAEQGRVHRA